MLGTPVTPRLGPYPAKLTAPRSARVLVRPRLHTRLDEAGGLPITWLSGPPGAGKTTLVTSYVEARHLRCIWYRLDAGDDAPETFFHYLGIAAHRAAPRHRAPLPVLTPEHLPALGVFARRFFEALCARWRAPAVLVLDNYQHLPEESLFHTIVAAAALALPEGVRLIVLSRAPPPPALARLRAVGAVALLDNSEFKLTLAEARSLSRLREKGRLKASAIEDLHERTGGWAAGLLLLLGHRGRKATTLTESTGQSILFDYFSTETFNPLERTTQALLCQLALLPELTAQLAEDFTGDARASALLTDLYLRNHFVVRQGDDVYQFHPLFHEFLLHHAERIFGPARLNALRSKAAGLLDASGHTDAAADQWRAASNWDALATHALKCAPTLAAQARFQTLESWLRALPAPMLDRAPWLRYWFAVCRMPFDPAGGREHFEKAFRRFRASRDRTGALLSWAGIVDTSLHLGRDIGALDRWIAEFPRIAGKRALAPKLKDTLVVRMFGALAMRKPDHPDIGIWRKDAESLLQCGEDLSLRLWAGVHLGIYLVWVGDRAGARQTRDWLLTLEHKSALPPIMSLLVRATEALYAWLADADTTRCLEIVEDALAHAEKTGVHVWDHHLIGHGAAAALSQGDMATARKMLVRLSDGLGQARLIDVGYYHFLRHWEALLHGDLASAEAETRAVEAVKEQIGYAFGNALFHMMRASLHIEQGRQEKARRSLREVRRIGDATHSRLIDYMVSLGEADLALRSGDEVALHERLRFAFAIGREGGLTTCHGWRAEPMASLCARALEAGIETAYVVGLIRRRALSPPPSARLLEAWPWPIRIHTLGRFAVELGGKAMPSPGKLARKPLDLLKHLVSAGPAGVSSTQVSEALWPDQDPEHSYHAYGMALHRLRRLLGADDSILSREGGIVLNPRSVFVDAWAFERCLEAHGESGEARLEQALALYRGAFLGKGGAEDPWTLAYGERLFSRYLRAALKLGQHRQQRGDFESAIDLYGGVLEHDDLQESVHQRLLECYCATGRRAEGLRAYERCRKRLRQTLRVAPSAQTEALRARLLEAS